jgi:hypothetical protein
MNTDNTQFDRLVDDELGEEERRRLLGGLDQQPGGWRRCALAFLEAQCWKKTFGQPAPEPVQETQPPAAAVPRRSPWPGRVGTLLAMAASFVAAMYVGSLSHRGRVVPPPSTGESQQVAQGELPSAHASGPWQVVTVRSPSTDRQPSRLIDVPAVERATVDERALRSAPPAIPDDVLQALARTGHQIQQHRELVPVPMQDGRQLIVPVDRVNVHYVGNKTY